MPQTGTEIPLPTAQEVREANAPKDNQSERRAFLATSRARIMASVVGIGLFATTLSEACGSSNHNTKAPTETPVATYPAGVDTPTNTPTETQTTEATITPTQTPETTNTPEVTKPHFTVEASEGLSEVSANTQRTIEQDKAAVQEVLGEFPQIGEVKVVLIDSGHSRLENNVIYLNRNLYSIESLKFEVAHEMTHYFDIEVNKGTLSHYLSPDQVQVLRNFRAQALVDPVWGSDYSLKGILDPSKSTVLADAIRANYTQAQIVALTNIYPDSVFVSSQRNLETPGPQPFRDLISSSAEINSLAQNTDRAPYTDIAGFLDAQAAKIAEISARDPIMKYVFETEIQNKQNLQFLNTSWSSQIHKDAWLTGPQIGDFWRGQLNITDAILINGFINNDPRVVNLFPQDKIQEIQDLIKLRIQNADEEKIAELGKVTVHGHLQTSLSLYFSQLEEYAKENALVIPDSSTQTSTFKKLVESTSIKTESGKVISAVIKEEDKVS